MGKVKSKSVAPKNEAMTGQGAEPIRSFCARVMILCAEVKSAGTLTHIASLQAIAKYLGQEAEAVQSIYGGHPGKPPKLGPPPPTPTKVIKRGVKK